MTCRPQGWSPCQLPHLIQPIARPLPPPGAAAGEHTAQQRSGRWSSAVLRQTEGGGAWRIAFIQETYVPQQDARA